MVAGGVGIAYFDFRLLEGLDQRFEQLQCRIVLAKLAMKGCQGGRRTDLFSGVAAVFECGFQQRSGLLVEANGGVHITHGPLQCGLYLRLVGQPIDFADPTIEQLPGGQLRGVAGRRIGAAEQIGQELGDFSGDFRLLSGLGTLPLRFPAGCFSLIP